MKIATFNNSITFGGTFVYSSSCNALKRGQVKTLLQYNIFWVSASVTYKVSSVFNQRVTKLK